MSKIFVIFGLMASILISSCDAQFMECEHEMYAQQMSPDGQFNSALDNVGCGATTGFVTWVLVGPSGETLDPANHQVAVFKGKLTSLTWSDVAEITVSGDGELFKSSADKLGISIIVE